MPRLRREEALALLLGATAIVYHTVFGNSWLAAWADCTLYVAAGLSGRWPRVGKVLTLAMIWALALSPTEWVRFGEYAVLIPLFGASAAGVTKQALLVTGVGWSALAVDSLRTYGWPVGAWAALLWSVFFAVSWLGGWAVRRTREVLSRELKVRASEERADLARELHDRVSTGLAHMVLRARRAELRGEATPQDLQFIITRGAEVSNHLRAVMDLLRTDDEAAITSESFTRVRGPDILADCVAQLRAEGFDVLTETTGSGAVADGRVGADLRMAANEAVANIIRHGAPDAPCLLSLKETPGLMCLEFRNRPRTTALGSRHTSFGVMGMRERLGAHAGLVEAHRDGDDWVTRLTLPVPHALSVVASEPSNGEAR